eukprot:TRINITY_DN2907_c0_g2_i1.p1 TRINITY_DN2907_c0_g2~~TRINITY_DN2907_c0_g2_i1.p1  ORF type:complete len:734 (-),score=118.44 TRINITY_DN2907_c0_g2_i1:11-2212(-)
MIMLISITVVILLLSVNITPSSSQVRPDQLDALQRLYVSTAGIGWFNNTRWGNMQLGPCLGWYGIECNGDDEIVKIDLGGNNLRGSLPHDFSQFQDTLHTLNLDNNHIAGVLPDYIADYDNLEYLFLNNNSLTGSIPDSWKDMTKHLVGISLAINNLEGTFLQFDQSETIREFYLNDNRISGTLPPTLAQSDNLKKFIVSNNQLTGTIPQAFDDLVREDPSVIIEVKNNYLCLDSYPFWCEVDNRCIGQMCDGTTTAARFAVTTSRNFISTSTRAAYTSTSLASGGNSITRSSTFLHASTTNAMNTATTSNAAAMTTSQQAAEAALATSTAAAFESATSTAAALDRATTTSGAYHASSTSSAYSATLSLALNSATTTASDGTCPGQPECSGHGSCYRGVCSCLSPYTGISCADTPTPIIVRPNGTDIGIIPIIPINNNSSTGGNNTNGNPGPSPIAAFTISLGGIDEVDASGAVIRSSSFDNFTLVAESVDPLVQAGYVLYTESTNRSVWVSRFNLIPTGGRAVLVVRLDPQATVARFAGVTSQIAPNTLKLSLWLLDYPFLEPTNELVVTFKQRLATSLKPAACGAYSYSNPSDSVLSWAISRSDDGFSLYSTFASYMLVDGEVTRASTQLQQQQEGVARVRVPYFDDDAVLDPNFAMLTNLGRGNSNDCFGNQVTSPSSFVWPAWQIGTIIAACIVVVIVIIGTALYMRNRRQRDSKKDKAYREAQDDNDL